MTALDCIPGMKGLTTLGGLARGLRGGLTAARGGLRGMSQGIRGLATRGRAMLADGMDAAFERCRDLIPTGGTDPVDLATGRMFLSQTDIALPGTLPLTFTRRVESGYRTGRWFGPSWSSTCDQRLDVDAEGVVFVAEDGVLLAYPHPPESGMEVLPHLGPAWPLARHAEGGFRLTDPLTGATRCFAAPDDDGVAVIRWLGDRTGNLIHFDRGPDGAPTAIRHSGGYHLKITTEAGRITALALAGAADDGGDVVVRRYTYTDGNLTTVRNADGASLRLGYDDRLRVTSWTDSNDRHYRYAYDDQDRCVAEGGEAGHVSLTLAYDGSHPEWPGGRVTSLTTAAGAVTRHVFDAMYRQTARIDANGAVHRMAYDTSRHVRAVTDPLGNTTLFTRNEAGQPLAVTCPDGSRTTYEYDPSAQAREVTLPDGGTWRRGYDGQGNCVSVTDPAGAVTRFTYDDAGRLTGVTDALGGTTHVRCDAAGLAVEVIDPLGSRTVHDRDRSGRIRRTTDPGGGVTRLEWTPEGRLARRIAPDGAAEAWEYDGEGNCLSYTDAQGGTSRFEYGHFDVLTARTGPDGGRYTFDHDASLRLTEVTDPHGLSWRYTYDPAGRLVGETDYDGRTVTYRYDAADRLVARTNGAGQTVTYDLDPLGRVIAKHMDGVPTRYKRDTAGRLTEASNAEGTLGWERDATGRTIAETVDGRRLSYRFDAAGRLAERVTPGGARALWHRNAAGRTTALETAGHRLDFTHDDAGREVLRRANDGLELTQTWDIAGRLTEQRVTGDHGLVQTRTYRYRADGLPVGIDDRLAGRSDFTLDAVGRVTAVQARDWTERYVYDLTGDRTEGRQARRGDESSARGPRTHAGARLPRLRPTRYVHDAAGRVVERHHTRISRKPRIWRYTWDAEDRLTRVTTPDGTVWRYRYDPFGRRLAKQRLAADGETVVEETLTCWDGSTLAEETTTTAGRPLAVTLTWHHEGFVPLTQSERLTDTTTQEEIDSRYFAIVTDLVGTPTELVDTHGKVAWRAHRTLWGVTAWASDSTAYTPLRFPGQYHDRETGLHYNYQRYYDPETARYISTDPLGLSPALNPHGYVVNPHTWCDPLGLAPYQRYRVDSRHPDEIFDSGFEPRGTNMDLEQHQAGLGGTYYPESGYVGTTDNLRYGQTRAQGQGNYLYDIRARDGGVDVNAALPGNNSSHEYEFAYPRAIDPSEIAGAWDASGTYHANPNFRGAG
ncbi:DUF6531 domain-containing protein [Streptomyces sp. MS19]|uniref:DUF6531 domain-containing protein n=1 Tax=Streptomyces sp. MS19 TaxID=3385972 RepID=UPI00399FD7B8